MIDIDQRINAIGKELARELYDGSGNADTAIKQLIRDVLAEVKPERDHPEMKVWDEANKQKHHVTWAKAHNAAIDDMEARIKALGP